MKKKILLMITFVFSFMLALKGVYAASASISASKTSVTVGTKVTITVKVNAAAWNLSVSGSASDSIVGFNMDDKNQTTTKTYTISTKKAGKYTVSLTGDITNAGSETATNVSKSVTVTVKEKPKTTTTTTTNNNNTTTNSNKNTTTTTKPTTTKKSSNANISALTLNVEGLKFKKSQTTYNIKVGENVDKISAGVTLESSKAVYSISGNKNLKAGNNVIKIVVTAEDGTTKTYKINVQKEGNVEETSSELSNLIIEDMTFTTKFNSTTTEYTGSAMKHADSLNILPYTVAEEATYEIIGNENLKEGENTIVVKVTSKDKSTTTEYKITFEMLSEEETNALQVVSPYTESSNYVNTDNDNETKGIKEIIMENSTIILLYLLALVEFAQVVYLYVQLKSVNPDAVTVKRRKGNNNK